MAAVSAQSRKYRQGSRSRRARRRSPRPRGCISAFSTRAARGTRPFGSFGLSLDRPSDAHSRSSGQTASRRSGPSASAPCAISAASPQAPASRALYRLTIEEAIPPHAGLGSGTQLALAVGSAFAALGRPPPRRAGRSPRGSGAAPVPASASPPSPKAASCWTAARAEDSCRSSSAASPSRRHGACC